jgi:hypothetical protein
MSSQPRGGTGIDLATVPRSLWISAGGALVLLISVFLRWYSVSVEGLGGFSVSAGISGWDATDLSKLVALAALVALGAWAVELFAPATRLPYSAWAIAGGAGAFALLLVLFRILDKPGSEGTGVSIDTSYGIWVALLASAAVVGGAYLRMKESP